LPNVRVVADNMSCVHWSPAASMASPQSELPGIDHYVNRMGARISFSDWSVAHRRSGPTAYRTHSRRRGAAAIAVRRRIRCILRSRVTPNSRSLLKGGTRPTAGKRSLLSGIRVEGRRYFELALEKTTLSSCERMRAIAPVFLKARAAHAAGLPAASSDAEVALVEHLLEKAGLSVRLAHSLNSLFDNVSPSFVHNHPGDDCRNSAPQASAAFIVKLTTSITACYYMHF
jgi:hypothetical protein